MPVPRIFCIVAEESAGGICLMWRDDIQVEILDFCKHYIHVRVGHKFMQHPWLATFAPYDHTKLDFWNRMTGIANNATEPWILMRDLI